MRHKPYVLLMIESSRAYGRGCLRGVGRYLRSHASWLPIYIERGLTDDVPARLRKMRIDGVLARIELPRMARTLRAMGVPVVDLRNALELPGIAVFDTDPVATAKMAADHLLERGFRHFAFCGFPRVGFSDRRCLAFSEYLGKAGLKVSVYAPPAAGPATANVLVRELRGALSENHIAGWLASLPKPLGLMACNDMRARHVLDACHGRGIKVPEEIAVIGVDNDEVLCDLCIPPLTSVEPDTIRIGFEGAAMIDRLMRGRRAPGRVKWIPPRGVVARPSTDVLAVGDPTLVQALHFIRERACQGIDVSDVLEEVLVSRSTLERLFLKALGRTPKEEIQRLRISRVKQLLIETNYGLRKIAALTGFHGEPQLITAFKAAVGQSPGRFRRSSRGVTQIERKMTDFRNWRGGRRAYI